MVYSTYPPCESNRLLRTYLRLTTHLPRTYHALNFVQSYEKFLNFARKNGDFLLKEYYYIYIVYIVHLSEFLPDYMINLSAFQICFWTLRFYFLMFCYNFVTRYRRTLEEK